MRTAIANNACKFHEDRLNDGVTIYFIVAKPRVISETWSRFFCSMCACIVSVTHRTACRAACVWTAVRSVYGQPKAKTEIYFTIAAMTAGQILVNDDLRTNFINKTGSTAGAGVPPTGEKNCLGLSE